MRRPVLRAVYRLAWQWGCTVGEAAGRVTARELRQWIAFMELEGLYRDDERAALVAATVANFSERSGRRRFGVEDFMPGEPTMPSKAGRVQQAAAKYTPNNPMPAEVMKRNLAAVFGMKPPA